MKLSRKIMDFFRREPLLKVISLLAAIVLWFFVVVKGQTEITIDVPIELKYIPKGLGVESKSNNTIMVTVRGFEQIIKNLKPYDIKVSVDLSRAKRGINVIHLTPREVILPNSLTVTAINPNTIRIRLDEIMVKRIPIKAQISGFSANKQVADIRIEPSMVEIEGFKSRIWDLRYIKTEPISLEGVVEDTTFTVSLEPPAGEIRLNPETVKVKILLRRQQ